VLSKRITQLPFVPGGRRMHDDPLDALLAGTLAAGALRSRRPPGCPSPTDGGNVLRPMTAPETVAAAAAHGELGARGESG